MADLKCTPSILPLHLQIAAQFHLRPVPVEYMFCQSCLLQKQNVLCSSAGSQHTSGKARAFLYTPVERQRPARAGKLCVWGGGTSVGRWVRVEHGQDGWIEEGVIGSASSSWA